ncbi:MAG: hypothetical protein WC070_03050 [Candidatus Magasanikbacteria bacterium]
MESERKIPLGHSEYNMPAVGISMGNSSKKPEFVNTKVARSYAEKVPSRDIQKSPLESLETQTIKQKSETQTTKQRIEDLRSRILKTRRDSNTPSSLSKD